MDVLPPKVYHFSLIPPVKQSTYIRTHNRGSSTKSLQFLISRTGKTNMKIRRSEHIIDVLPQRVHHFSLILPVAQSQSTQVRTQHKRSAAKCLSFLFHLKPRLRQTQSTIRQKKLFHQLQHCKTQYTYQ